MGIIFHISDEAARVGNVLLVDFADNGENPCTRRHEENGRRVARRKQCMFAIVTVADHQSPNPGRTKRGE
jgi:hypothetical protein